MSDTVEATIDVLVVEDHAMVAQSLARALHEIPAVASVEVVQCGEAAVAHVASNQPDIVMADFNLPDLDGAEVARRIEALAPATSVIMVTAASGVEVVKRAVDAGCRGFVHKSASLEELVAAVTAVANGDPYYTPEALQALLTLRSRPSPEPSPISEREREVLQLVARGASVDQIAVTLGLSVHTVRNHLRRAMQHLSVHSRLEAVVVASRDGLIDLGPEPLEPEEGAGRG